MTLFLALVRSSTAVWVGPLAMALAVWYANNDAEYAPFDPYVTEHTAAAADPLFLTLSVVAACAAWEGGRLRRAGWTGLPSARLSLTAAAPLLVPPVLAGIAALLAGLAWKLHLGGVGFVPDMRFLPTFLAMTVGTVVFGFALGTLLPPVIAVPAMLVGVYSWMVLPVMVNDPIWFRHLSGRELASCCMIETDVDPRALIAALLMAIGLTVAGWAILATSVRQPFMRLALLVAPLALGFGGGAAVARDVSQYPEIARDPALLVCTEGTPGVCVWPEHQPLLPKIAAVADGATAAWAPFLTLPDEFTEAFPNRKAPGVRYFVTSIDADRSDLLNALAFSMIPEPLPCTNDPPIVSAVGDLQPPYHSFFVADYVVAWLEATAGADAVYLAENYEGYGIPDGPDVVAVVDHVRALPMEEQRAWLERNLAALSSCDVLPRIEP